MRWWGETEGTNTDMHTEVSTSRVEKQRKFGAESYTELVSPGYAGSSLSPDVLTGR